MLCTVALLALFASVQGRAVNISNTWVLPEEGFPVFYRYFRDRISWYEADAVCQFHHANLVTVDTTAQYDAVRAYLKELDISSAVWVGLIRSNTDGDFTWTDYRGLSGDGYWSSAPDPRVAPLCAAADPTADYRWKARACGGPTVASFICELPVPQWALGSEGCMVRALPALTILYLPESAAVQLTADCGLAGVKRIQCTGNVKRQDLLKDLSCTEEEEGSTAISVTSSEMAWSTASSSVITDQDTTIETTTEENVTSEQEDSNTQTSTKTIHVSPTTQNLNTNTEYKTSAKPINYNNLYRKTNILQKNINLNSYSNNNLHSNIIPKISNGDNYLYNEQLDKIEDEKHMQHKMLHEEIARLGNLENIFTQPTDHFVPPLVMAKAKIGNDMTVLSLQEKHAQEMAEQYSVEKNYQYKIEENDHSLESYNVKSTTEDPKTTSIQSIKSRDSVKKDKNKTTMPKKYKEKAFDPKGRIQKSMDIKPIYFEATTVSTATPTETLHKHTVTTFLPLVGRLDDDGDSSLNLTVVLKDAPDMPEEKLFYNYSGDISRLEVISNYTQNNETEVKFYDLQATEEAKQVNFKNDFEQKIHNVTFNHEGIKTTTEIYTSTKPQVFEISSKVPIAQDYKLVTPLVTAITNTKTIINVSTSEVDSEIAAKPFQTTPMVDITVGFTNSSLENDTVNITEKSFTTTKPMTVTELPNITSTYFSKEVSVKYDETTKESTNDTHTIHMESTDKINIDNHDEMEANLNSSETIDDYNSPLLSAANLPLPRPNRSRRPHSQPSQNKFNPFRILG